MSKVTFREWDLYVTGGMSWGDGPTESYVIFDAFLNLPGEITGIESVE